VLVISFQTALIFILNFLGCKQFNAYGFCVHCIMVGSKLAKGLTNVRIRVMVKVKVKGVEPRIRVRVMVRVRVRVG
jgi:hypothetical protein